MERLYATGSPEGRAYALAGLKELDPERFKVLFASEADSTESVAVMLGCIRSTEFMGLISQGIDRGDYARWLEANAGPR